MLNYTSNRNAMIGSDRVCINNTNANSVRTRNILNTGNSTSTVIRNGDNKSICVNNGDIKIKSPHTMKRYITIRIKISRNIISKSIRNRNRNRDIEYVE